MHYGRQDNTKKAQLSKYRETEFKNSRISNPFSFRANNEVAVMMESEEFIPEEPLTPSKQFAKQSLIG